MASNKIQRINEDIQRVLADRLREVKDPRVQQGLISIVTVDTSGDLRWCKVYLSVLGLQNPKEFKKGIKSASGWLRREIGNTLNLRYTPELVFVLDDSLEHGAHISRVLEEMEEKERAAEHESLDS
ncbi:MAG: 30S ribosome-binding factor RbfA [Oscillospiraceae bacterium]|nr:30S ribosome-binding factor RbfA [Oscillospiraceae bacterium]